MWISFHNFNIQGVRNKRFFKFILLEYVFSSFFKSDDILKLSKIYVFKYPKLNQKKLVKGLYFLVVNNQDRN